MPTTYCTAADVDFVLSEAGVSATVDDLETGGARSADMDDLITRAIEIAAADIRGKIRYQYKLADVSSSNEYLRNANSYLAAERLMARRANPCPPSIADAAQRFRDELTEIRWGRMQIPDQSPSFEHSPTVSNFTPQLGNRVHPVPVDIETSVGSAPPDGVKRPPPWLY